LPVLPPPARLLIWGVLNCQILQLLLGGGRRRREERHEAKGKVVKGSLKPLLLLLLSPFSAKVPPIRLQGLK